jgi:hypothetical protein
MNRAQPIGVTSLDFLNRSASNWRAGITEDIIQERLISLPLNYLFTLGSGVYSTMTSLATIPAYHLPTTSQFYLAGRDVFRWGGMSDPLEVDIDRYGFTPDYARGAVVCWKAPKSEPHHLSEIPGLLNYVPSDWKEICEAILGGNFVR